MDPRHSPDDGLSAFVSARPRLFGIAYRMRGSAAEAEDIVQDVWLRWQATDRSMVRNATAFLATTTMRLAINLAQSASSRHETETFVAAAQHGDLAALEGLLASDVVSSADGGGIVRAAQTPLVGRARVASAIEKIGSHAHYWVGITLGWIEANGQSAVLLLRDGAVVGLATIEASAEGIDRIMWVMRPSKLAAISLAWHGTRDRGRPGIPPDRAPTVINRREV